VDRRPPAPIADSAAVWSSVPMAGLARRSLGWRLTLRRGGRLAAVVLGVAAGAAHLLAPAAFADPANVVNGGYVVQVAGTAPLASLLSIVQFTGEDPSTGAVTGSGVAEDPASSIAFDVTGTVSGQSITFTVSNDLGYTSTWAGTISDDTVTITGAVTDAAGASGTFVLTLTGNITVPTPTPAALPLPVATALPARPAGGPGGPCPSAHADFGGPGAAARRQPIATSDPALIAMLGTAGPIAAPESVAMDAGDPRGRVFVVGMVPGGAVTIIDGRSLDPGGIAIEQQVAVGGWAVAAAVDQTAGRLFLADQGRCQVHVLDARAATPSVQASIDLPCAPSDVAYDPTGRRVVVACPDAGAVLLLGPDLGGSTVASATLATGANPTRLLVDDQRGLVFAASYPHLAAFTNGLPREGSVSTIDLRASPAEISSPAPVAWPVAMTLDDAAGRLYVADWLDHAVAAFGLDASGGLTSSTATPTSLGPAAAYSVRSLLFLPGTRTLLATFGSGDQAYLYSLAADGTPVFERAVDGVPDGAADIVDPATGRVFVAQSAPQRVSVLALDTVTAPASLAYVLPGPLDISLNPADLARSAGITGLVMLLLSAPTPLFNSTLAANRGLIERWVRRKRPRRLRSRPAVAWLGSRLVAFSRSWTGLVAYLLLAALVYAFLDAGFPSRAPLQTYATVLIGIAIGTAISQLPREHYVRRRHRSRGEIRVALWVLVVAAACVVVTRLTGVQPGYVYGIIGGFVFAVTLTAEDRGRMAFRGMTVLLAAGIAAWFLRIPFEPGRGPVGGEAAGFVGKVLAGVFITAIEAAAIGLIPLHFLEGEPLYAWSRRRWAVLWVISLVLFTHVLLYPVSDVVPSPSPTGVWTVVLAATAYALIALGFWWFFSSRERRRRRRRSGVAALA